MKVLISVDMEGVAGVVARSHAAPDQRDYERFRKLMTEETNAAIEGAIAGGADKIVVDDSHWDRTNILIEDLNPAATLISGSPQPMGFVQGVDSGVDAIFFIGYHAASGVRAGVLAHTVIRSLFEVSINGMVLGEVGFGAALAGDFGVPIVLVTGDRAVTEEARDLLGDIETVAVKEGIGWAASESLTPAVACQRIKEAAKRAMGLKIPTFVIERPLTLRVVFPLSGQADLADLLPGSKRIDGCTVEWVLEDMVTVTKQVTIIAHLSTMV